MDETGRDRRNRKKDESADDGDAQAQPRPESSEQRAEKQQGIAQRNHGGSGGLAGAVADHGDGSEGKQDRPPAGAAERNDPTKPQSRLLDEVRDRRPGRHRGGLARARDTLTQAQISEVDQECDGAANTRDRCRADAPAALQPNAEKGSNRPGAGGEGQP